jgi:type IV secretory pathway TraG/TraD family ATPase VirD4
VILLAAHGTTACAAQEQLVEFQDLAQLEASYGRDNARSIINNCRAKVLLPAQGDLGTLETFSRAIGDTTVHWQAKSWNADGKRSSSEQRATRALAAPEVLRTMKQTVLIPGESNPAQLKLRGWWEVTTWNSRISRTG